MTVVTAERFVPPTVVNHPRGYELPDLPLTPIDESTGLPYCFFPNPDFATTSRATYGIADWNHQFPRVEVLHSGNPVLQGLAKLALMNLRVQLVNFDEHHDKYNPCFIGPLQPGTDEQLAITIAMGLAEYVPSVGIDLSGAKPVERHMDRNTRDRLWNSGQLRVACESSPRMYLFDYIFRHDVDHIRESELDEFLHTFDRERKLYLGHTLVAKIIERAAEPIDGVYATARKNGEIPQTLPKHSRDFLKAKITAPKGAYGRASNALHHRFGEHKRSLLEDCMQAA